MGLRESEVGASMIDLEADGIGEPVIIGDQIMIPIGDVIYSGSLQLGFKDILTLMKAGSAHLMGPLEATKSLEDMVEVIQSKFTPENIIYNLRNMENANWVMETYLTAYNELSNPPDPKED